MELKKATPCHTFQHRSWIHCTNSCCEKGAITVSKDNKFHVWTKHIDICYHLIHTSGENEVLPLHQATWTVMGSRWSLAKPCMIFRLHGHVLYSHTIFFMLSYLRGSVEFMWLFLAWYGLPFHYHFWISLCNVLFFTGHRSSHLISSHLLPQTWDSHHLAAPILTIRSNFQLFL